MNLTFAESGEMSDFQKSMDAKVRAIAADYYLIEKIVEFEDETDYNRIMKVLEQCMWVGYCAGKGWE